MSLNLDSLNASSEVESSGVGKDETGSVTIQSSDNQPVQIQTSDSSTAIQVNDDASIQLNSGIAVDGILNVFNDSTPSKNTNLASIQSIVDFFEANYAGLKHFDFEAKSTFDAKVWTEADLPAAVFVVDSTPFSYTDTLGKSVTDADWIMLHVHWESGAADFHITSSSESEGQMTDAEIKTAYEANSDTNAFTDAYKGQLDNAPANINNSITTINSSITTNSNNISINQTNISNLDSSAAKVDSANDFTNTNTFKKTSGVGVAVQNTDVDGQVMFAHKGSDNNFKHSVQFEEEFNRMSYRFGSHEFAGSLPLYLRINSTAANFLTGLQVNGNNVLTVNDYSSIKTGLDAIADTNFMTDTERSKVSNIPSDVVDELNAKFDSAGGTISGETTITNGADKKDSFILQRTSNILESGIAWQNSGDNRTKAIYQEGSDAGNGSGDLVIATGNESDVNNLSPVIRFKDTGNVVIENNLTAGGILSSGNLAVGSASFTGTVGATGDIETTAGDVLIRGNNLIGNSRAAHTNNGTQSFNHGCKLSTSFAGMKILETWDGSNNDFDLSFHTLEGGSSNLEVMRMNKAGNVGIGNTAPTEKLDVTGNAKVSGNATVSGKLKLADTSGHVHQFEADSEDGITLRTLSNGADGSPIFQVKSSGGGMRLRVEHSGFVSTTNQDMKVGTASDGTGGNVVLHEGNYGIYMLNPYYFQDFPTLSASITADWSGKNVSFVGVGSGTVPLPEIVASGAGSGQINAGEMFVINNFNSGSAITIAPVSGQKQMVSDVGNIVTGNLSIPAAARVRFIAMDLRTYSTVSAYCWAAFEI